MKRGDWFDLARKLDWEFSYVREEEVFPPEVAGRPWRPAETWRGWDEPYGAPSGGIGPTPSPPLFARPLAAISTG